RARFSWGLVQFTATGGLPGLLVRLSREAPGSWDRHFAATGIGVDPPRLVVGPLRGWRAINHLHDDESRWRAFVAAAHDPAVQRIQVLGAHPRYVLPSRTWSVMVDGATVSLGRLLGADPLARTALADHAVHRGPGYTVALFE